MPDEEALPEGVDAEVDSEAGAPDLTAEQPVGGDETPPSEPREFLELDDSLANSFVRLKVDGEEIPVKLSEALQGYNREAVSTKRFQEAAKLREEAEYGLRIQQALELHPELTIRLLAEQAGLTPAQFMAQQEAAADQEDVDYDDPLEKALAEEREARLALERRIADREADETLRQAVNGLKQRYGVDDSVAREVVGTAFRMKVGPEAFDTIYQALEYQKLTAQQQAAQERQQQQRTTEEQRQAAAQRAQQVVGAGTGAANTTEAPSADQHLSIREAFEQAWEEAMRGR